MTSETPAGEAGARRLRLTGLHHVTAICRDAGATTTFYRDVLGLAVVQEERNPDDPDARHVWFGDGDGSPGTLVSFLEYPHLADGEAGPGLVHHFALAVASLEELRAWRDYLRSRGTDCSEVLDRGRFWSLYLRDPDGNMVEIAAT